MTTYTINVTQEDIDKGAPSIAAHCPLALAISRATGKHTTVGAHRVVVAGGPSVPLPPIADEFRAEFDSRYRTVTPAPFSFELDVPDIAAPAYE